MQRASPSSKITRANNNMSLSKAYTKGLGYIFLIAFLSYYVQYPALSSSIGGIEPSNIVLQRAFPSLYIPVDKGYIDSDGLVELINLVGVVVSIVIASGVAQHALLYLLITAIYYFLVILGGQFYTFQWDILLVEVGFLTAFCFAPWRSLHLTLLDTNVGCWPIRFLLFKLMFMSGIVKIQAECPTWQNLTALEYHFATQCLPGPLAWYAHQLPPFLLRLGVATTFVIEIPATIFLIVPWLRIRRIGAWMQIVLQVLIIATGNYNFFNVLTMALCIPCMIGEGNGVKKGSRDTSRLVQHQSMIQSVICVLFLAISCKEMFHIEQYTNEGGKEMRWLKLSLNRHDCNNLAEKILPPIILFTILCTFVSGVRLVRKNVTNLTGLSSLMHTFICLACIVVTAMPLFDLSPGMHRLGFMNQSTLRTFRRQTSVVSHGYGLFRRMTGVGKASVTGTNAVGLPPSVVARPEIVLEAIIVDVDGNGNSTSETDWQELNFRWKPGGIDRRPRQVAPHQPRFEWRMWFAALGTVRHNAWLVSFVDKILAGCPYVIDLLDEPELKAKTKRIQMVRAQLYEYDFTRVDNEWARNIPGVHILDDDDDYSFWWQRKAVGQYLPALDSDNESLREFLRHTGYGPACRSGDERCNDVGPFCQVASFFRRIFSGKPQLFSVVAIFSCAIIDVARSLRVINRRPKVKRD